MAEDELTRLRRENHALRDRMRRLEDALGIRGPVPQAFRSGPMASRVHTWRLMCAFAQQGALTRDQVKTVLYGDRAPKDWPGEQDLDNKIGRLRACLLRHGIVLTTRPGVAWELTADMRACLLTAIARYRNSGEAAA
jgi:hypothetical protein